MMGIITSILEIGKVWGPWGIIFSFIIYYFFNKLKENKKNKEDLEKEVAEQNDQKKYIENMLDLIKMIIRNTFKLGQNLKNIEDKVLKDQRKEIDDCGEDVGYKLMQSYEIFLHNNVKNRELNKNDYIKIYKMIVHYGVSKGKKEMYEFVENTLADYSVAEYELQKQNKTQKILNLIEEIERDFVPDTICLYNKNEIGEFVNDKNIAYIKERLEKSFDTLKHISDKSKKEIENLMLEVDCFEEKAKKIFLQNSINKN